MTDILNSKMKHFYFQRKNSTDEIVLFDIDFGWTEFRKVSTKPGYMQRYESIWKFEDVENAYLMVHVTTTDFTIYAYMGDSLLKEANFSLENDTLKMYIDWVTDVVDLIRIKSKMKIL